MEYGTAGSVVGRRSRYCTRRKMAVAEVSVNRMTVDDRALLETASSIWAAWLLADTILTRRQGTSDTDGMACMRNDIRLWDATRGWKFQPQAPQVKPPLSHTAARDFPGRQVKIMGQGRSSTNDVGGCSPALILSNSPDVWWLSPFPNGQDLILASSLTGHLSVHDPAETSGSS